MSRRVTAAVGAAALLAVALPALPALASAASSATLAADDTEVLPGSTPNIFDITVRNGETNTLLSSGRTVNRIRVIVPREIGIKIAGPLPVVEGWDVTATANEMTGLHRYDLKPKAGNAGLAPGASLALPLPAEVARPFSGDRSAAFQVAVSSNAGETYQTSTGSLGTTIRTLKVKAVDVVDDTVAGVKQNVADGSATAGQRILTQVTVENYATSAQTVTAALRSEGGAAPADAVEPASDTNPPRTQPVDGFAAGAPGTKTFTIPVKLGEVTSDTARAFTGSATSDKSSATTPRFVATRGGYAVQAAPTLSLTGFKPPAGNTKNNVDFVVSAVKTGTPALTLPAAVGGAPDVNTLTLRNRSDATRTSRPVGLKDTEVFGTGTSPSAVPLEYVSTLFTAQDLVDGRYDALFAFSGTDDNGAPLLPAQRSKTLGDVFNFDNLIPTVDLNLTLPTDADGDRTTAARNFDGSNAISVSVTGTDTGGAPERTRLVLSCVQRSNPMPDQPPLEYFPHGTPTETTSGNTRTVTASFQVASFAGCLKFQAEAIFRDLAGNTGQDVSSIITVDNTVPNLSTEKNKALTGSVGRYDGVDPEKASIMVAIEDDLLVDGAGTSGVIGGCDPRAYSVDGQLLVRGVYVREDGVFRECTVGLANARASAKPSDNVRYLRLTNDISRGGELPQPQITYTARTGLGSDRIKDAAGNYAPNAVQDTVNRLAPLAPVLVTVKRNTTKAKGPNVEDAYFDGTSYYTRVAGNDLQVTVNGALDGDTVQLLNADNEPIPGQEFLTSKGAATVTVPLLADETIVQRFGIRFVSPAPANGEITNFSVVYDATAPLAVSTGRGSGQTATVTFGEPIIGSNAAVNWNAFELVEGEDGKPTRAFRGVSSVAGAGNTRTLTADFTSNPYGGALYQYLDNVQYEDYAGNDLFESTLVEKK